MSKRGYISRYLLIIKKLKAIPYSTFDQIQSYIESQVDYLQMQDDSLNIGFSKRTFQRDIREIRNIFGIDIEYSKSEKGYLIFQSEMENMNFQRMMEAFDMFNSLNISQDLKPYIHLEKRPPQGTENLYGLLHSIKNKLQVKFMYQKFWEKEPSSRSAEPYALKEFKNRWYIVAKDMVDNKIKTFALDRLTNLDITTVPFTYPVSFDVEKHFRYCFGIICPQVMKPVEVILSFEPYQGKYIKSLKLHENQDTIIDSEQEYRIKLKICITFDFVMELLSYAGNVQVLKPKSLANKIRNAHLKAFRLYL